MQLALADIQNAWAAKDPALVDYIVRLATQSEPEPLAPVADTALIAEKVIQAMHGLGADGWDFQSQSAEEQYAWRIRQWQLLEAENAEVPLPARFRLYQIILLLWQDKTPYARHVLLQVIETVPLLYGPWRALKHIFKAAEAASDHELLGAIAARCDTENHPEFSRGTLIYMRRRAWRYLYRLGKTLPVLFPEAAIHFLAAYPENTFWEQTWIANHIFYHETGAYGWSHFGRVSPRSGLLKHRAFRKTWLRSPEPLLRLLGMARAEKIREYACEALKQDFKLALRDVAPQWLISLSHIAANSPALDNFIVWLLKNSPRLEQQAFRELGLHQVVLALLVSEDATASGYAIQYARVHAKDLERAELLRLAVHQSNPALVSLVQTLLGERHPREEIGLAAWGQLLCLDAHHKFAATALLKHFGRQELSPEWFMQCMLHFGELGLQFARQHLHDIHPAKTLGVTFYSAIIRQLDPCLAAHEDVAEFVMATMQTLDLAGIEPELVQFALLHPLTGSQFAGWLEQEKIRPDSLPLAFCQALACETDWAQHPFVQALRHSDQSWANDLCFDTGLALLARGWLADPRYFAATDLGLPWLMALVNSEDMALHEFAVDILTKAFVPADFAPATEALQDETDEGCRADENQTVDLAQQTFLFTGKLKTMTRKVAEDKVVAANGKNSGSVTAKLDYLVIGDEGSPLYGNGRKGSKQVSAEKLIAAGAGIRIISETAFLQMLAGTRREVSADAAIAGCEALWAMTVNQPDSAASKFAIQYLRHHHPELCLRLTDRPVDPGAEIPPAFITLARFKPLFHHASPALRGMALDYARYEFSAWQPGVPDLIALSESKYGDVREFVRNALLETPAAENRRYRIDAGSFAVDAVHGLCEAVAGPTRQLGMELIRKYPQFQQPEVLFRLTESPDRALRSFAVRVLWAQYRHSATTRDWQPQLPLMANLSKTDQAKRQAALQALGHGLPERPAAWPATPEALQQLLRRWLYELPPGRGNPPGKDGPETTGQRLKPLSACAAKKALIETFRDLALEEIGFARLVLPLLQTFTRSNGRMEQSACLVAVTRLHAAFPMLAAGG